jgi:hypothetical protein
MERPKLGLSVAKIRDFLNFKNSFNENKKKCTPMKSKPGGVVDNFAGQLQMDSIKMHLFSIKIHNENTGTVANSMVF